MPFVSIPYIRNNAVPLDDYEDNYNDNNDDDIINELIEETELDEQQISKFMNNLRIEIKLE